MAALFVLILSININELMCVFVHVSRLWRIKLQNMFMCGMREDNADLSLVSYTKYLAIYSAHITWFFFGVLRTLPQKLQSMIDEGRGWQNIVANRSQDMRKSTLHLLKLNHSYRKFQMEIGWFSFSGVLLFLFWKSSNRWLTKVKYFC